MANITLHVANRYYSNVTGLAEYYGSQTATNFEVIDSSGVLTEANVGSGFTYGYNGFFNGGTINSIYFFSTNGTLTFSATGVSWSVSDRNNSLSVGTSSDGYYLALLSGNDSVVGSSGDDQLYGSKGNDAIDGGNGVDLLTYKTFNTGVTVNLSTGYATNYYGTSTIANIEDVEGSAYGDVLTGNASNNSFQGFAGNDTISGGSGTDTVIYRDATYAVTVNLSTGFGTGGSGSDTLSSIERVIGSRFNDTLIGSSANESFLGGFGNDSINGGGGTDTVEYGGVGAGVVVNLTSGTSSGGAGIDTLVSIENVKGSVFADLITGNAIANTLYGGAGNDTINGGLGIDASVYTGTRSQYTITQTSLGLTVADHFGTDGSDTLSNIERLEFTDSSMAFDIDGIAGQAYRIYQAAFNRTPDLEGLGYWIGEMDHGTTLTQVSNNFLLSSEFQTMYGANPSNEQFLTLLYNNVLHRDLDQAGFDYWSKELDNNISTRAQVLAGFSESAENQAALIGAIENGIVYISY